MSINFYIISGMSGAGKSQALKIFEDFGFYCVDNMPLVLMKDFTEICLKVPVKYTNVAISIDIRSGTDLSKFVDILKTLRKKQIIVKTLFLDCNALTLIKRFSETRRKHPIGKPIVESISLERGMLKDVLKESDKIIDTSHMTIGELKNSIAKFSQILSEKSHINISLISFGYKYGIPLESDIVFDIRFLSNPNYVASLKNRTGKDISVKKYLLKQKDFNRFFTLFSNVLEVTIPAYISEGKSYLTISIGCTGGQHRSVFTVERLSKFLKAKKYNVNINHRDILRSKQ
jgi:UPF0042 nucleotide-binding protein